MNIFLNSFYSYFTNRTQAVKFSFHLSQHFLVSFGVPQGFYLGPLSFLIFIDDLPRFVLGNSDIANILILADDANIFSKIKTVTDQIT